MKKQEFLLGAAVYLIVIAIGFSGPMIQKLRILPWDKSIQSPAWNFLSFSDMKAVGRITKKSPQPIVRQMLSTESQPTKWLLSQEVIHANKVKNWEHLSSRPSGLGKDAELVKTSRKIARQIPDSTPLPMDFEKKSSGSDANGRS